MDSLVIKKGVHCLKCPYCKELFVHNIKNEIPINCPHCGNCINILLKEEKQNDKTVQ